MHLTADPGAASSNPQLGHITFVETDYEIFSMLILLLLIQEGQLSVTDKVCAQILVNGLEY